MFFVGLSKFSNFSVFTRVSKRTKQGNFLGQRDKSSFIVPVKGTMRQTRNLAKGRDGPGQPKFGTGRAGTAKIWDGTLDKMGQSRKGHSKTGK